MNEMHGRMIEPDVPTIADCFVPLIMSMMYARMNFRSSCINTMVERHTPGGVKVFVMAGCNPNCKLSMPMHKIALRSIIVTVDSYTSVKDKNGKMLGVVG